MSQLLGSHCSSFSIEKMVLKANFPPSETIQVSSLESFLNQISKQRLESMLCCLKAGFQQLLRTTPSGFTLYEDLLLLCTFRLNQHKLCPESINMIYLQLSRQLEKSPKQVRSRHQKLIQLQFKHIEYAIDNNFDIVLGLGERTKGKQIHQLQKFYCENGKEQLEIRQLQNSEGYLIYLDRTSQLQHNSSISQKNHLSQQEKNLVQLYQLKLELRKIKQTQLPSFINSLKSNCLQTKGKTIVLDSSISEEETVRTFSDKLKVSEVTIISKQIAVAKNKLKKLIEICEDSKDINQSFPQYEIFDNVTGQSSIIILWAIIQESKWLCSLSLLSQQEIKKMKGLAEILMQILHVKNRRKQIKEIEAKGSLAKKPYRQPVQERQKHSSVVQRTADLFLTSDLNTEFSSIY